MRTVEYTNISATTSELANLPVRLNKMNEEGWAIEGHLGVVGGMDGVKTHIFLLSRPINCEDAIKTEPVVYTLSRDEANARGLTETYPHEWCEWESKSWNGIGIHHDVYCSYHGIIVIPNLMNESKAAALADDHNSAVYRRLGR